MKNQERQREARRRYYYKNRHKTLKGKPYITEPSPIPSLSPEDLLAIRKECGRLLKLSNMPRLAAKKAETLRIRAERKCKNCGSSILHNNQEAKFCTRSCFIDHRRISSKRNWTGICRHCLEQCTPGNKYCSICISGRVYSRIRNTETAKDSKSVRNFLIRKNGHTCENCKLSSWCNSPIALELHHLDGDGSNNKEINVQMLCPNCHSLTPTFRNKNRMASETRRRTRKTKEFRLDSSFGRAPDL